MISYETVSAILRDKGISLLKGIENENGSISPGYSVGVFGSGEYKATKTLSKAMDYAEYLIRQAERQD
jgi:hypothetical protein